ncbi:MAG TPA: DUF6785 family protein [Chthonomonadaceae bacterium]|nr:DUF6785 family protein [Chthonomonadaceae bacterium]
MREPTSTEKAVAPDAAHIGATAVVSPDTRPAARPRSPLTLRAVLFSLLLIPANAWWLIEIEYVRYSDNATTQALFFNAVSLLLILMGLNALLRRVWPRAMLAPQELVALYVVVAVASNLAGHDQLQILFTTLTYVFRHDTPETGWGTKIIPYLPTHLMIRDREAIGALYEGNSTLYRWDHLQPWLAPLGWWTLFVMLVVWTMLCLTALFRRQWDAERLNYPIAEIPIQIITQPNALLRSPLLWGGAAIGASGQIFNLLHSLYPSIPGANIGVENYSWDTYPWNAAGPLPICTYPFAYGLSFLLPTQLGFSVWFFFLMSRVQLIVAAMWGYAEVNPWGRFPYIQQQGVGAILGIFLTIVWTARGHLQRAWNVAIGKAGAEQEDTGEPLSYRAAVFGLIGGFAGLVWFAAWAGMRWQTALLFLGILFIIVLVVARLRAELGLPTFELYQVGADQILQRVSGTSAYPRGDLVVMTLCFWLTRTHRQFPMQTQVDAIRLGRRTETALRPLALLILGASLLGTVAAFWAMLHSMYQVGYDSAKFRGPGLWAFGREPWQKLDSWITSPQEPDRGAVGAYLFGLGFTLFLAAMRTRFFWWPFHPAGYMVSGSFGLFRLWLPIFASWLIKVLILRYGGLRAYRRFLPFFLGLILGEFSIGFARTLLDLTFGLHLPPSSGIGGL